MVEVDRLRKRLLDGNVPGAPPVFGDAPPHKTLRSRLTAACEVVEALQGAPGGRATELAHDVLHAKGDPAQILQLVHAAKLQAGSTARDARGEYRMEDPAWSGYGLLVGTRVTVGMAADLIWMPYAEGLLLARDVMPVGSLRTDVHSFALAMYNWAVIDYPAVALAVGAALRPAGEMRPLWCGLARQIELIVEPHVGGAFTAAGDRRRLTLAAEDLAVDIVHRLTEGRVPQFYTAPALTGKMIDRLAEAFPQIRLDGRDPVGEYEVATNRLVFDMLVDGQVDPRALEAMDQLQRALHEHDHG
jgi:hypothetical protein